jgi:hypothetical protein
MKAVIIHCCNNCPNKRKKDDDDYCYYHPEGRWRKIVTGLFGIPNWCPLPDVEIIVGE